MGDKVCLTELQKEKLGYYFDFFDGDGNKILEMKDFPIIMKKILDYTGWEADGVEGKDCFEVCHVFFEVMREKSEKDETNGKVELKEWFDIWNKLLPGCKGLGSLPIWLRRLPPTLFKIIDFKGDGVIDEEELARFYEKMVNLPEVVARERATEGIKQMTDGGRYPLDIDGYEQIFANFLIGRTLQGPGRFIFGGFSDIYVPFKMEHYHNILDEDEQGIGACGGDKKKMKKKAQSRNVDQRVKRKVQK